MTDVVTAEVRSKMMSGIKSTDTQMEVLLRSTLHSKGFRFRKNVRGMPGTPDMVFPKYRAVIELRGCFWHRHDCYLFKWPRTRPEFWKKKLDGNAGRDERNLRLLERDGWRVLVIWECFWKRSDAEFMEIALACAEWLKSGGETREFSAELSGKV